MGDCVGALLAYEAMCQEQWSIGSFETNSSHPVSPTSKQDDHMMKNKRLSSSDIDIRSPQYDSELEFPKKSYSIGSKKSASVDDGLDSTSETYSVCTPFRVRKLEFDVSKFFAFGSPIGLVLLHKRLSGFSGKILRKCCILIKQAFVSVLCLVSL